MKKLIVTNLFIILLTGIFLYGKNHQPVLIDTNSSESSVYGDAVIRANIETISQANVELTAKLENYRQNDNFSLKLKKENDDLALRLKSLEKENYKLLSFISSQTNYIKQLEHSDDKNLTIADKVDVKKEYETIKYKKKIVHADAMNKNIQKSMNQVKRAPASLTKALEVEIEKIEIKTTLPHVVQVGEDLMKISKLYYNTHSKWNIIASANPELDMKNLVVGQTIIIPNIEEELVVWVDGKMKLKKDITSERKPATINTPVYE